MGTSSGLGHSKPTTTREPLPLCWWLLPLLMLRLRQMPTPSARFTLASPMEASSLEWTMAMARSVDSEPLATVASMVSMASVRPRLIPTTMEAMEATMEDMDMDTTPTAMVISVSMASVMLMLRLSPMCTPMVLSALTATLWSPPWLLLFLLSTLLPLSILWCPLFTLLSTLWLMLLFLLSLLSTLWFPPSTLLSTLWLTLPSLLLLLSTLWSLLSTLLSTLWFLPCTLLFPPWLLSTLTPVFLLCTPLLVATPRLLVMASTESESTASVRLRPSLTSTTESTVESVTMVESTATVRPRPSPTPSARFMPAFPSTTPTPPDTPTMLASPTISPTGMEASEFMASVRPRPTPSDRFMPVFPSTTPTPLVIPTMLATPATFPMAMGAMDSPTMDNLTPDILLETFATS